MAIKRTKAPQPTPVEVACSRCGGENFEAVGRELKDYGSVIFVRCANPSCRTVVSALDGEISLRVEDLATNLSNLESSVDDLESALKKTR